LIGPHEGKIFRLGLQVELLRQCLDIVIRKAASLSYSTRNPILALRSPMPFLSSILPLARAGKKKAPAMPNLSLI